MLDWPLKRGSYYIENPKNIDNTQLMCYCTGSEKALPTREEESSKRVAVHPQGPISHCHGRLAEGPRDYEGLDQAVVCAETGTTGALQKS